MSNPNNFSMFKKVAKETAKDLLNTAKSKINEARIESESTLAKLKFKQFEPVPLLLCDFYKVSHRIQYPEGTTLVYSNGTPRNSAYYKGITKDKVLFFGMQYFIKNILIDKFNNYFFNLPLEKVVADYSRIIKNTLFVDEPDVSHVIALHKLGYLPLEIKAIEEGTLIPYKVPAFTIVNTHGDFYWLTNAIETIISNELWLGSNNATLAFDYRVLCEAAAEKTCDNRDHVPFQCHDFSMRGMASLDASMLSGMAHLLSFKGTDTVPAIMGLEYYYGANIENELVGTSIPTSEHSVMCAGGKDTEEETYRRFIEDLYPNGFVSIVSDTWDFFGVLTNILPNLKDKIMARNGRTIIRLDSSDPVNIICGMFKLDENTDFEDLYKLNGAEFVNEERMVCIFDNEVYDSDVHSHGEDNASIGDAIKVIRPVTEAEEKGAIELLWELFGGTINEKGYKVLDSHIGLIYGDSITLERAQSIFERLEAKGFASSNVVLGVGSYTTYQYNTRDSQGWAIKATYCEVNGECREIFKEPKTDSGKKSAKGLLRVEKTEDSYVLHDQQSWEQEADSALQTVFFNGEIVNEYSLAEIRDKIDSQFK